ncbi:Nucleoside permease NupC [hydrothermal vent metagenome]|uniref:Nucleoside permease NupC n=1 Tax=hydrothermal vent metagenome TaxID=652676 RepID=A0A1W1BBV5_9ZZZZ
MQILMGLVGMFVLLSIAVLFSNNRKAINLRTIGGALLLQATIPAIVLLTPWGASALKSVSNGVQAVIDSANSGISFLFGPLVSDKMFQLFEGNGFVFALKVLPVIIFFASLMSVLYHLKIMQVVIKVFGGGLQKMLGTSRTESMSAAANIFVGQTEAPLVVKPYINTMTSSELFAIMAGGLASVAGAVLAGYASMGVSLDYLIAASFMAAPGGLLMAKILVPETEKPNESLEKEIEDEQGDEEEAANVLDAAAIGASSGLQLALNVGAMLLAFIALISLLNMIIGGIGGIFGYENITMQMLLGYLFSPIAYILGIPWSEAVNAGSLLGQKLVINEFVAYVDFVANKESFSAHSQAIISVALCGFANLSSIAILLGGLGVLAPSRRKEIARFGLRAVLAGTLSNFMSATLVGIFMSMSGQAI